MAKEYIEREAAIELLSQPITMSMCLSTEECHRRIAQQRIDRYLIENIPAADVREVKWISVEEALPEENGRYLVRYKRDMVVDYTEVHDDEVRIMRFFVDDGWRYPFLCQPELRKAEQQIVTHWMVLPNLPVEENANG